MSPTTWMPLPLTHSIHCSAWSLAHAKRPGGSRTGADSRCTRRSWASSSRISSSYSASRRVARSIRRLSCRITWVSATPSEVLSRSLSSGAHSGSMPNAVQNLRNSSPGSAPPGPLLGHGDQVDALGRDAFAPVGQHARQVEGTVEPRLAELDAVEEPPVGPPAALLDALLPGGGQRAGEVAGGVDDVHLAAVEVAHRPGDHVGRRGREDLVADDAGAGLAAQPSHQLRPRAVGVTGLTTPVLAEQVERRPELEQLRRDQRAPRGDVDVVLGEGAHVAREPVLEVRRPRLRCTDVQVDDPAHAPDCGTQGRGATPIRLAVLPR